MRRQASDPGARAFECMMGSERSTTIAPAARLSAEETCGTSPPADVHASTTDWKTTSVGCAREPCACGRASFPRPSRRRLRRRSCAFPTHSVAITTTCAPHRQSDLAFQSRIARDTHEDGSRAGASITCRRARGHSQPLHLLLGRGSHLSAPGGTAKQFGLNDLVTPQALMSHSWNIFHGFKKSIFYPF